MNDVDNNDENAYDHGDDDVKHDHGFVISIVIDGISIVGVFAVIANIIIIHSFTVIVPIFSPSSSSLL